MRRRGAAHHNGDDVPKTTLMLEWFIADNRQPIGWKQSGRTYGSKGAFTREWRGGAGFVGGSTCPARLVNTKTGEVVWQSNVAPTTT